MKKIKSFEIDHNILEPGIYISRVDLDITTYDIRMKKPNANNYLENDAMHTIEHILATYLRNSEIDHDVIYVGPMGCKTGFYILIRNANGKRDVEMIKQAFLYVANFEGEIPGNSRKECGNYKAHDLKLAKKEASEYYDSVSDYNERLLFYKNQ